MSAILGSILIDVWNGPAPPPVKSTVELLYKPGQSAAAARILPNQSTSSEFESLTITDWASAHTFADGLRSLIGTIVSLTYRGTSYGNVLVQDVTVLHIDKVMYAQGVHPDGTTYSHANGGRITARWRIVRLA